MLWNERSTRAGHRLEKIIIFLIGLDIVLSFWDEIIEFFVSFFNKALFF